jgi:two-component system, OmpR family, response regulator
MRVLVVEDEKRIATALRRGLEAEGFAVDVALDGTDGDWLARENKYDVVVLDIMLPGINGYQLCAGMRERGDWTPVLMLTAKDGDLDQVEALDTGADDYVTKPFSYLVLVSRIRALLRRSDKTPRLVYEAGDLKLDPLSHECWRGEVPVRLTGREMSVLEFLMRRRGEVVPKSEILANVWDFAYEGDPNIVEVYVRHLRRKIDEPFGRSSIQTIRGVGYRLGVDGG